MIFSLVAMTGLEKCCITSAYLQWLCHSGEQHVARGPLVYLLDNIFIRFWTKLYRQTIGILMGTYCVPHVADLFLFCNERDFMKSPSQENQADFIEAFNTTSRYLDVLLNIDNIYFDQLVDCIYPTEFQLNRANSYDTEAPLMPTTWKKLEGHIASGAFVHPFIRSSRFLMHSITLEPCMLLFFLYGLVKK